MFNTKLVLLKLFHQQIVLQLEVKVNVEYPEQILPQAEEHYFNVSIVNKFEGRNFSIMHSTVCAK